VAVQRTTASLADALGEVGCDKKWSPTVERQDHMSGDARSWIWRRVRNDAVNYISLLQRLLLLFWAIWLSVVFLTNLADAGKGLGLLDESWAFASGNWKLIQETTARYRTPAAVKVILFAGVILWEGVAALLFWRAGWGFRGRGAARKAVYLAFTTSLLLWRALLVADEVFIAYPLESTHLRLFVAHLVTLLAVDWLPAGGNGSVVTNAGADPS
jgi:hypothetical protein